MKKITVEEFQKVGAKELSPAKKLASKIVEDFIATDDDVVEVEEKDFNNEFKFNYSKQALKAATLLRNVANKHKDICVKQRSNRLFIGKRSKLEPNFNNPWRLG